MQNKALSGLRSYECNIPPVEARAGTAFPRDFQRARPREILRKNCSFPSFDWWYNILILVRGTGIFFPALRIIFLPAD